MPVVRHFQPLRHQSIRPRLGLIVSVSLHMAIVLPFVVPSRHPTQHESLITQMVVFLVPPDRPVGRQETSEGLDWGAAAGNRGAVQQHQADKAAKEKLPEGKEGEEQPVPSASVGADTAETAVSVVEVDSSVVRDPTSAAPEYPVTLLRKHIEGSTFVHYVVDTSGLVDTTTIRVLRTTHAEFAQSVKHALAHMHFRPALQASRKVRQWVEQSFSFKIVPPAKTDTATRKPS